MKNYQYFLTPHIQRKKLYFHNIMKHNVQLRKRAFGKTTASNPVQLQS